jgi:hypothetical protein
MREPMMDIGVIELRQYQLVPGRRDELIDIFDSYLVEPQEECGMRILGQFHDLDRPDWFVWLRGFQDMTSRTSALASGGSAHPRSGWLRSTCGRSSPATKTVSWSSSTSG